LQRSQHQNQGHFPRILIGIQRGHGDENQGNQDFVDPRGLVRAGISLLFIAVMAK